MKMIIVFNFFLRRTIELVCGIFFIRDSWNFFPCTHSHLSLFFHNLGIIKAPISEAGSDARRCEGSTGVDIRVHPLPAPSGATGGQQEGGGNSDCYLSMCILELNTHLLVIYAHLFLHNNKAPSCTGSETNQNWNHPCFRKLCLAGRRAQIGHVSAEGSLALFSAHAWHVLSFLTFASKALDWLLSWTNHDMQR